MPQAQDTFHQTTEPQDGWLQTSQLRMHYLDWGGSGPFLVALHGLASSAHWYDLVLCQLVDRFHCIALDQRAHGQTDQPPTGYDWLTVATDVVQALDALEIERAVVLGHSWGSNVALNVAAHYPERVHQLVLIDGGFFGRRAGITTWEEFKARLAPRDIYGPRERYLGALRQQLAECWSVQLEGMLMSMVRIDPDGSVHERLEPANHEQVLGAMWEEPPSTVFPMVACPTLLVPAGPRAGANSEFARRKQEGVAAAQAAIPNCRVEWVPDTMHDIGYHKPKELAAILGDFLASPATGQTSKSV